MSVLLDINGTEYAYPEVNDQAWGADATDWAVAVTNGMLQKAGGLFILLDDVDFGTSFGLISKYYTSRTANAADAGQVRLAQADTIDWRNAANDGNLALSVSADVLTFNGVPVGNFVSVSDTATIDLTLAAGVLSADVKALSITNALVSASAAIAVSKLAALTVSRAVVTDGSGFISAATTTATEIGYVNGVTSAIQTQLNAKQATGNYITALTGDGTASGPGSAAFTLATVNSNTGSFGSSTAIPSITVNGKGLITAASTNAVIAPAGTLTGTTLASNVVTSSLTSVGTIATGVWNGTTIALANGGTGQTTKQPAFDALSPLSTKGDIAVFSTVGTRLGVGADGTVLTAASGQATGLTWTSPLTNPMNAVGDIIIGGSAGAATKLGIGTTGQFLTVVSGSPAWTGPNLRPQVQTFTSSSGTYNQTYAFTITSGNATAAATYTNNGVTFTVVTTVASATLVYMTGANVPAASGTLTKATGTGDATLTFSSFKKPLYLKVFVTAGGGGGGGSGSTDGTAATAGSSSTFGSSLLTATGGALGARGNVGGTGGSFTVAAPAIDAGSVNGGSGGGGAGGPTTANGSTPAGASGGGSFWGGSGGGGTAGGSGNNGSTNTGGGGGGGGCNNANAVSSGAGGGAGGTAIAIIENPSVTYAWVVGANGTGQAAGTNGRAGGDGAAGKIVVEEHYQ
jgi:hypothetical protein